MAWPFPSSVGGTPLGYALPFDPVSLLLPLRCGHQRVTVHACKRLCHLCTSSYGEDGVCRRDGEEGGCGNVAPGGMQRTWEEMLEETLGTQTASRNQPRRDGPNKPKLPIHRRYFNDIRYVIFKYLKFVGPGFLISVAYIDPGNYATNVSAGASYRFKLLFMILLSNLFAIFLQTLCIKLGTVTGLNLAEMCRAHLPRWLNYMLYFFAEAAIIATDIAEVIGTRSRFTC